MKHEDTEMRVLYFIAALITAIIGMSMHGDILLAIIDFLFWPIIWAKWLIFHEVNLSIIKHAFAFFLQ